MKRLILFVFVLAAVGATAAQEEFSQSMAPSIDQTANSASAGRDDSKWNVHVNAGVRFNPWCDDEKVGIGVSLEAEWKFMQRIGIGAGLGYSTERMSIHHYVGYNLPSKFNYRVSFINAPLRLYYHPAE